MLARPAAATLLAISHRQPGVANLCASFAGDNVLKMLEERVELEPGNAGMHFELAAHHMSEGATEAAARSMRASLELNPTDMMAHDAYLSIADTLFEEAKYEAAATCWQLLREMDPQSPAVSERLAAAFQRLGRFEEAAELLLDSLESPELESPEKAWLWVDLGALLERITPIPGSGPEWPSPQPQASDAADGAAGGAPEVRIGTRQPLSALECYRRAISLDPGNGQAHKSLADALVVAHGPEVALADFERARELMPDDVCCATHCAYGAPPHERPLAALAIDASGAAAAAGQVAELATLTVRAPVADDADADDDDGWAAQAARLFETHGVVVIPGMLDEEAVGGLMEAVSRVRADESATDFRAETREAQARVHMALPLRSDETSALEVLSGTLCRLYPLLRRMMQVEGGEWMPLLGSGFMCVAQGAAGQELHKGEHSLCRHLDLSPPVCVQVAGFLIRSALFSLFDLLCLCGLPTDTLDGSGPPPSPLPRYPLPLHRRARPRPPLRGSLRGWRAPGGLHPAPAHRHDGQPSRHGSPRGAPRLTPARYLPREPREHRAGSRLAWRPGVRRRADRSSGGHGDHLLVASLAPRQREPERARACFLLLDGHGARLAECARPDPHHGARRRGRVGGVPRRPLRTWRVT